MKDHSQNKYKDLKCIWMSAGIVNYKLCDNDFNCETCEFHKVMLGNFTTESNSAFINRQEKEGTSIQKFDTRQQLINRYLFHLFSDCKVHLDRFYCHPHFWIKFEQENRLQVGIDKTLLKILEPVEKVVLPEEGQRFQGNQLMVWILRKDQTLPLYSPIKGQIVELNPQIKTIDIPQIIKNDDYLFKINGNNFKQEIEGKYTNLGGLNYLSEKIKIIKSQLQKTFQNNVPKDIGPTLADGGEVQLELEKVIGEQAFDSILKKLSLIK